VKLLSAFGPSPRMVRMFIAEKGLEIPIQGVDLFGAENRQMPYRSKNPFGTLPCLVLEDNRVIAETAAICEYLDELHPSPSLIGTTAWERAEARMFHRRVELNISEFLYNAYRWGPGLPMFESRTRCVPEAAEGLRAKGLDGVALIDSLLQGKTFLCGKRITTGDLVLYCCLDFFESIGQPVDSALKNVLAWKERMNQRPSSLASLSEDSAKVGMRG
jgi:glutathione S-transferase